MIKQKRGFFLFLASLIPGAGELYMGFRRQGLSIMLLFWSLFALGAGTGMDWLVMFVPVIWLYSFFNVHNLKSLSEEEFYSLEDSYILHFEEFIGEGNTFFHKYRTLVAVLLIVFGFSILWNNFSDILYWVLPGFLAGVVREISYQLPQIIIAIAIVIAGFYILSDKKHQLKDKERDESSREHYWEPYRPFQQSDEPDPARNEERPFENRRPFRDNEAPANYYQNTEVQPPVYTADEPAAPFAETKDDTVKSADEYPPYPEEELIKDENA
ncbi:hypothetical protein NXH76_08670 [Blautia schinkii]|nr:hypothetical protein [Blautia schinkii]